MEEQYYRLVFIYSKKLPRFIENAIEREFLRLRPYAVKELNLHFDEWNSQYTGPEASEDDKLADYGGTEYCKCIRENEREVLAQVNRDHPSRLIKLDADEIGDIIAVTKIGNITITMEFEPVKQ